MLSSKKEISALTGLRGIAALCIVFAHWGDWVAPTNFLTLPPAFRDIFAISQEGMTIFFVLSGFVIAYNYGQMKWYEQPGQSLLHFGVYRFARLYPLYLVFIMYTLWTRPDIFPSPNLLSPTLKNEIIAALLGVHSWLPFVNEQGETVINGKFNISWSISTEFFLYITFAIMMLVGTRISGNGLRLRFILIYALVTWCIFQVFQSPYIISLFNLPASQYWYWLNEISPVYRMFEFGTGMLACWVVMLLRNNQALASSYEPLLRHCSIVGASLITAPWLLVNLLHIFPEGRIGARIIMIVGGFLIIAGSEQKNQINRFLNNRILLYIGLISYSIYLFHFVPPGIIARRSLLLDGSTSMLSKAILIYFLNFVFGMLILISMSTGLHKWVEMPSRNFIRKWITC